MARSRYLGQQHSYWRSQNRIIDILVKYDIGKHQERDAIDAYTRAFDLGLDDSQCQDRLNTLQDYVLYGTSPPPLTIQMEDFDLRIATYDV